MFNVSKKVKIMKRVMSRLPGYVNTMYTYRVGSGFTKPALTESEKDLILPALVNSNPKDVHWHEKCKLYFDNISVLIPDEGKELEIGMRYNKQEDVTFDSEKGCHVGGFPLNPADYVLYRHCLVYGPVANKPSDVDKSPKIRFYILDEEKQIKEEASKGTLIAKAMAASLQLDDTILKRYILTVANDELQSNWGMTKSVSSMREDEVQVTLFELAKSHPDVLLRLVKDKEIEIKAMILEAISTGELTRFQNTQTVVMGEGLEQVVIGSNMKEAVFFLKDPKNANIYNLLIARTKFNPILANKKATELSASNKDNNTSSVAKQKVNPITVKEN